VTCPSIPTVIINSAITRAATLICTPPSPGNWRLRTTLDHELKLAEASNYESSAGVCKRLP
jgi:hypothetical protein